MELGYNQAAHLHAEAIIEGCYSSHRAGGDKSPTTATRWQEERAQLTGRYQDTTYAPDQATVTVLYGACPTKWEALFEASWEPRSPENSLDPAHTPPERKDSPR